MDWWMESFLESLLHFVSNFLSEHSLPPLQVRICVKIYVNECLVATNYCYNLRAKKNENSFLSIALPFPKKHCFCKSAAYRSMKGCGTLVKGYEQGQKIRICRETSTSVIRFSTNLTWINLESKPGFYIECVKAKIYCT